MARKSSPFVRITEWSTSLGLAALIILGALFRFISITNLPPGLSGGEANIGLSSLELLHHGIGHLWSLNNSFAPLWTILEAIPVAILGHTALALRLLPALLGVTAIFALWLWIRDWFGARDAWIGAFLLAVTPWGVVISRSASPASLAIVLLPVTLYTVGRAYTRGTTAWLWLAALTLLLDLASGPLGWVIALIVAVLCVAQAKSIRVNIGIKRLLPPLLLVIAVMIAAFTAIISTRGVFDHLANAIGLSSHFDLMLRTFSKVVAMFNLHGDDNFLHNFNGEPMLNAFVGLMFIAGLLVSLTRFHFRGARTLVITLIISLLPALLNPVGAPNASRAALALPLALALAAIGTSYMLDLWYTTFPINSAARSTGLAAIILLLGLTAFQGYVQTFRAWADSAETYLAYGEGSVEAAHYLAASKLNAQHYFVGTSDEQAIVRYLNYDHQPTLILPNDIATIPVATTAKQFVITATIRDIAASKLSLKYAGGKLEPHYSSFSQNELFYNYEKN
jgi:4-amino-4-deoxy-L-arabinose transferase-like glycosyltransferase